MALRVKSRGKAEETGRTRLWGAGGGWNIEALLKGFKSDTQICLKAT